MVIIVSNRHFYPIKVYKYKLLKRSFSISLLIIMFKNDYILIPTLKQKNHLVKHFFLILVNITLFFMEMLALNKK